MTSHGSRVRVQVRTIPRVRGLLCGAVAATALLIPAASAAGAAGTYEFELNGISAIAGFNYQPVVSDEPIDLAGHEIHVSILQPGRRGIGLRCPPVELDDGLVYTLISSTGGLSGELQTASGEALGQGAVIPIRYFGFSGDECFSYFAKPELQLAYHESGEPQTLTATVVNGSTERLSQVGVSVSPEPHVTNQPVTLTATVEAGSGAPLGTVTFLKEHAFFEYSYPGPVVPGCQSRPLTEIEGAYRAICHTSVAVTEFEPLPVFCAHCGRAAYAEFEPATEADLGPSVASYTDAAAGKASTTTTVAVSPTTTVIGEPVVYTATVTPEYIGPVVPTGMVEFLDDGQPIGACSERPLSPALAAEVATATCRATYSTAGEHEITALYVGDGNFLGATTLAAQTVNVQAVPAASTEKSTAIEPVAVVSTAAPAVSGSSQEADTAGPLSGLSPALPFASSEVRVVGRALRVLHGRTAVVLLRCSGELACTGKVTLSGRVHRSGDRRALFGSAVFSIAAGDEEAVTIPLTPFGRTAVSGPQSRRGATLTLTSDAKALRQ